MSPADRRGFLLQFSSSESHLGSITAVIGGRGLPLTIRRTVLKLPAGGCMKDIHEVLRIKQARYAQLAKQIEMLQQAAEKLREVAPLLAEIDDDDATVLSEVDEQPSMPAKAASAAAGASAGTATAKPARGV